MGIMTIGQFTFNILDYIVLGASLLAAIIGWKAGFVNASKMLIMLLGGFIGAAYLTIPLMEVLWNLTNWTFLMTTFGRIVSVIVVFILSMVIIDLILKLFKAILKTLHLKFIDKLLGLLWGVCLVGALGIIFVQLAPMQSSWNPMPLFDTSFFVQHIIPEYLNPTLSQLNSVWPAYWDASMNQMQTLFS